MHRIPHNWLPSALCLLLLFPAFVMPAAASGEKILKVGGVGSALGSLKLLAAAFEKTHPGVTVKVLPSLGSGGGIKAVDQRVIDIGIAGRPMNAEEQQLGQHVIEYARTPLVFITGKGIKKTDLTTQELLQILRGDMQSWPDGQRLRMILRQANDSETLALKAASPEIGQALDSALTRMGMQIATTSQDCADNVAAVPGAIGYNTLTLVKAENRPLKVLSYNGVPPGLKNIADGSYPFSELLYMVTKDAPSGLGKQFVDFVLSPAGKKILNQNGNLVIAK